jgi:MFS family permease
MVPALFHLFEHGLQTSPSVKDKRITIVTGLFLVLGCFVTFLAPNLEVMVLGQVFFALGQGFTSTARSLITFLVDTKHRAFLYTTLSLVTYTGALIGTPALAQTFSWGMQLGEMWMGLPFLVAGISFAFVLMAILFAPTERRYELVEE